MAILQDIAQAPAGASRRVAFTTPTAAREARACPRSEFDEIMADLESDWYVVLDPPTNEYYYLLSTMKDWWKRYYRTFRAKKR